MFKLGFYQFNPVFGKTKKNLNKVVNALQQIDADLIVLPELPFTGYYFQDKEELMSLSEELDYSPTLQTLINLCTEKEFYLVTGFAERKKRKLYNSALFIGPEGLIYTYRKIHLFDTEKNVFDPGNDPPEVQEVRDIKIGIMICFDWIFPETMRILALKGAQIICHPANLVLSYCQQAMLTRCLENKVFAITANRFGTDKRPHGSLRFTGKSQIVAPKGELLQRANAHRENLFIIEIDPRIALNKKITQNNDLFVDRRVDLYQKICSKM